ncbi:unnamed protein product [Allacma fusca]|uniref:Uncharacterized protein n=1 Tax=Allacma fusca TaxID=39272 RepID=A0A8J2L636_9HEXA|nr:unnamed protein product [Allacma fusca]
MTSWKQVTSLMKTKILERLDLVSLKGRRSTTCMNRKMKIIIFLSLSFIIIGITTACLFHNPTIFKYPLHASCNVTWTFKSKCNDVASKLVNQISVWKTNETCGTGQKCLYGLDSLNGNTLKATHTTPVKRYVDDLTFSFYPNTATSGCNVVGHSESRVWYAILDYGTNYCNLHNLVDGAGLQSDELYSELTRDEICTQYTSSNCEKY